MITLPVPVATEYVVSSLGEDGPKEVFHDFLGPTSPQEISDESRTQESTGHRNVLPSLWVRGLLCSGFPPVVVRELRWELQSF